MLKKRTVRILLINNKRELLLMRVVDPLTTDLDREPHDAFWCTIGGKIEQGETLQQAAYRELFEETGLDANDIELGPIVWHGVHEMIISGTHMELDEHFIVAHLKSDKPVNHENFTEQEKNLVTHTKWLSLNQIITHHEPIYPAILKTHLAQIISGNYPAQTQEVDLALQP